MLEDISEGDRLEVTGVTTLDDASKAIEMLFDKGLAPDAEFHCYLRGNGFAIWTTAR